MTGFEDIDEGKAPSAREIHITIYAVTLAIYRASGKRRFGWVVMASLFAHACPPSSRSIYGRIFRSVQNTEPYGEAVSRTRHHWFWRMRIEDVDGGMSAWMSEEVVL